MNNKKIYILFLLILCSLILIFMNKQYIVSFYNDYVKKFYQGEAPRIPV